MNILILNGRYKKRMSRKATKAFSMTMLFVQASVGVIQKEVYEFANFSPPLKRVMTARYKCQIANRCKKTAIAPSTFLYFSRSTL